MAFISRTLKAIAKELNVPMIALSQLNRPTELRGGSKRPQLSDLRESGAIEQDADIVAFIHRPEYYGINQDENGMPTAGMAEIILAKHRNGAVCDVNLRFLKEQARFADVEDSMLLPAQAADSQQAYDDYASGSNAQPGTSGPARVDGRRSSTSTVRRKSTTKRLFRPCSFVIAQEQSSGIDAVTVDRRGQHRRRRPGHVPGGTARQRREGERTAHPGGV